MTVLWSKSIGEISNVPTAAAVINAVNNALGTSLSDLPVTADKILAALTEQKRGEHADQI